MLSESQEQQQSKRERSEDPLTPTPTRAFSFPRNSSENEDVGKFRPNKRPKLEQEGDHIIINSRSPTPESVNEEDEDQDLDFDLTADPSNWERSTVGDSASFAELSFESDEEYARWLQSQFFEEEEQAMASQSSQSTVVDLTQDEVLARQLYLEEAQATRAAIEVIDLTQDEEIARRLQEEWNAADGDADRRAQEEAERRRQEEADAEFARRLQEELEQEERAAAQKAAAERIAPQRAQQLPQPAPHSMGNIGRFGPSVSNSVRDITDLMHDLPGKSGGSPTKPLAAAKSLIAEPTLPGAYPTYNQQAGSSSSGAHLMYKKPGALSSGGAYPTPMKQEGSSSSAYPTYNKPVASSSSGTYPTYNTQEGSSGQASSSAAARLLEELDQVDEDPIYGSLPDWRSSNHRRYHPGRVYHPPPPVPPTPMPGYTPYVPTTPTPAKPGYTPYVNPYLSAPPVPGKVPPGMPIDEDGPFERPLNQGETQEHLRKLLENVQHTADITPQERRLQTPADLRIQLLEHQRLGLEWMLKMEQGTNKGGILADDMGLGKTIQSIALIVSNRTGGRKPTLVVAPQSLIYQWQDEILQKVKPNTLKVYVHHGDKRTKSHNELKNYDVVITTYGILSGDWPGKKTKDRPMFAVDRREAIANDDAQYEEDMGEDAVYSAASAGPLFKVKWRRVILDEAHTIKNKNTVGAKACVHVDATYRWCLTGTPIQNNIGELYSLLNFLRIKPFCDWYEFRTKIQGPFSRGRHKRALARVQGILQATCLRRNKQSELDGRPIITLPPKQMHVVEVEFTKAEREFYTNLEQRTQLRFNAYLRAGTVMKNYTNVLTLILRLRQACVHASLVSKDFDKGDPPDPEAAARDEDRMKQVVEGFAEDVKRRLQEMDFEQECVICYDAMTNPVITSCGHVYCKECLSEAVNSQEGNPCPACRGAVDLNSLVPVSFYKTHFLPSKVKSEIFGKGKAPATSLDLDPEEEEELFGHDPLEQSLSSTKIDKLLEVLEETRREAPEEKTVVFSQFTGFLDLIEGFIRQKDFKFVRFDGTMSATAKSASTRKFATDPATTVMLVSTKAGSLGLNLTCANRVVLLDPWWNPAVENQAMDRVHRFGQTRDVKVWRFIVSNSVEGRIMALQEKKRELFEAALGEGGGGAIGKMRLGVRDLMMLFDVGGDDRE